MLNSIMKFSEMERMQLQSDFAKKYLQITSIRYSYFASSVFDRPKFYHNSNLLLESISRAPDISNNDKFFS